MSGHLRVESRPNSVAIDWMAWVNGTASAFMAGAEPSRRYHLPQRPYEQLRLRHMIG